MFINIWFVIHYIIYSSSCLAISANAGLEIKTPVVIPIKVVTANPFKSPADAAPIPMKPRNPVSGIIATNVVVKAVFGFPFIMEIHRLTFPLLMERYIN